MIILVALRGVSEGGDSPPSGIIKNLCVLCGRGARRVKLVVVVVPFIVSALKLGVVHSELLKLRVLIQNLNRKGIGISSYGAL
jgi:hypothetical protein